MANEDKQGTSDFTFADDQGAPFHPANAEHAQTLFRGGTVKPPQQLQEIVVGPAPFGSPDNRTLAHRMIPINDEPNTVAPELDADFVARRNKTMAGDVEEIDLDELTKDELQELADQHGVDYAKSDTKDELKDKIYNAYQETQDNSQSEGETQADSNAGQTETESPNYDKQTKADLLELAEKRNVDVTESNSKAEIVQALEDSDNATNE